MGKKKRTTNNLILPLVIIAILVSFAVLLANIFKTSFQFAQPKIDNTYTVPEAGSSAIPASSISSSTSPKPVIAIPVHSGKQVRVPILTYHYIGNNPNPDDKARDALQVTPERFEAQMEYISKNGYNTISLDTLYAALKGGQLPPKPLVLTFDDGYIDFYINAFPIMRRFNIKSVSFLPTGLINQGYYMSWSQIKEIDATGLVSFQTHSVTHPNLTAITNDQLKFQLVESKKTLEAQLNKPVNFMAYPYGYSDARVWNAVEEVGYLGSVGTWYGVIESEGVVFNMPRVKVSGEWSIEDFAKRLN